jgi:hypothetical protein
MVVVAGVGKQTPANLTNFHFDIYKSFQGLQGLTEVLALVIKIAIHFHKISRFIYYWFS